MTTSIVTNAYIVPGQPHILLAHDRCPAWRSLYDSYGRVRDELQASEADVILYFSTQWLSVLGYMFQGDAAPKWHLVDPNFHDFGTMHYDFRCDVSFAKAYADCVKPLGHNTKVVNYEGFPIDTGSVVANKLLNPDNQIPAAFVSCNMYAEKDETIRIGQAASQALAAQGKKAAVVLVSNLSARYEIKDVNPQDDRISSLKDDEWNRKILDILGEGRLEDVSQLAREYARQANADMGFKGIWWLNGLLGQTNELSGQVFDYQPVWGTGAALVGLYPKGPIGASEFSFASDEGSQAVAVEKIASSIGGHGSVAGAAPTTLSKAPKSPQDGTHVHSQKAPEPVGPYPHARRHNDLLFLSGMGPRKRGQKEIPGVTLNAAGEIVSYDIRIQSHAVFENLKTILADAGSSMDKVLDVQVFLTNMKADFKAFNEIYGMYFNATTGPSRTTVEVGSLPTPIGVELKVIAKP